MDIQTLLNIAFVVAILVLFCKYLGNRYRIEELEDEVADLEHSKVDKELSYFVFD